MTYTIPTQLAEALTEHGYEVVAVIEHFAESAEAMHADADAYAAAGLTVHAATVRAAAEHLDGDDGPRLIQVRRVDYATGLDGAAAVEAVRESKCPQIVLESLPSDAPVEPQAAPYFVGDDVLG